MRQSAQTTPITWQIVASIIAPLVLFSSIVGTFSVTQYRIGAMEAKQTITDSKVEDIQDKTNSLTLDIAVIKTKLGIDQQSARIVPQATTKKPSSLLISLDNPSFDSKENTSGTFAPTPTKNPNQSVKPTPTPTPTQEPTPIFEVVGELLDVVNLPL